MFQARRIDYLPAWGVSAVHNVHFNTALLFCSSLFTRVQHMQHLLDKVPNLMQHSKSLPAGVDAKHIAAEHLDIADFTSTA